MRHLEGRDAVRYYFLCRLSKRQSLGLGEEVGHQEIMVLSKWVQSMAEPDEVTRDQFGPLVDELVEGMLTVGSRLPPDNGSGLIVHPPAFQVDVLPVALHVELLEVGGQVP